MTAEQEARTRAAKLAQSRGLFNTMVVIQTHGCTAMMALTTAIEEHVRLHKNCPCCQGSVIEAIKVARDIVAPMDSCSVSGK